MNQTELRKLTRLVQRASAALTPLDAGMTHDGRPVGDPDRTRRIAFDAIREAARLVDSLETPAGCSDPRTPESRKGDPTALRRA